MTSLMEERQISWEIALEILINDAINKLKGLQKKHGNYIEEAAKKINCHNETNSEMCDKNSYNTGLHNLYNQDECKELNGDWLSLSEHIKSSNAILYDIDKGVFHKLYASGYCKKNSVQKKLINETKKICETKFKGIWSNFGLAGTPGCKFHFIDIDQKCAKSSDCMSNRCLATKETDMYGRCSGDSDPFGCYKEFGSSGSICVD